MKHAVKNIHFVGVADPSREQGSRLRDATGREDCQMSTSDLSRGGRD